MENLVSLNSDGTFPAAPIPVTQQGQFPHVGVTTDHKLMVAVGTTPPVAGNAATFTEGTKTVTLTTVPERLVAVDTFVTSVVISPLRTNTGRAYVGTVLTDGTQSIEASPVVIQAPDGKSINLKLIYIDVTVAGEGVSYLTLS